MMQTLDQYHSILKNENLKTLPDKSFFFLDSKLLKDQIQNNHIHLLKSNKGGILK